LYFIKNKKKKLSLTQSLTFSNCYIYS